MDWVSLVYLLVAALLVLLNGFFVLAEFALVKVRATRIEELAKQGDARAGLAREMVASLDNYLSATQLGITVASLGLGWVGEPAFAGLIHGLVGLPRWWSPQTSHAISAVLAFLIITFLHILLGELAPKSLAIRRPESSALAIAQPMRWAYRLFYLPMIVLNGASNWILRRMGLEAEHHEMVHTEHELRLVLSQAEAHGRVSLNRLLILENIFDLGRQTVRDAMIPWAQVRHLSRSMTYEAMLREVTEHRYSRWPVLDQALGKPVGYLLMKDLVLLPPGDAQWTRILRPLRVVAPGDSLELTMHNLQTEGANMAIVLEANRPLGLIALEDILEEIVGRIEDEYPRQPRYFLKDALRAGGVVMDLKATTAEAAIRELVAAIPRDRLPGVDVCALALERERQVKSDVGHGVAVPHARCPGLAQPLLVIGRSESGILFDAKSTEPVRLVFLIVTPAERPNLQAFFLAQIASAARSEFVRERLLGAETAEAIVDVLSAADPAVTG